MSAMPRLLLSLLLGVLLLSTAQAQHTPAAPLKAGQPLLTCFSPKDHGGGNQDWVFAQDARGVLYVGDNLGVLEYDGASWRLIQTATNNVVRALDTGEDNRVYVGSATDFGYLIPDAVDQLEYVSLLDYVPEEERDFNDIWTVHATPDGIFFQARERLFRFRPQGDGWEVKVWRPQGIFYFAFWQEQENTYYVHQGGVGLMKMVDEALELLPGGEQFAGERLQVMLPYEEDQYLVGSFNRGLFLFDGRSFTPFRTDIDALLQTQTLYKGAVLPDGSFGLATIDGGLVMIDWEGNALQHLNRISGLSSDAINAVFVDRSGLVWLSPENSICQFEALSPLTRYDATSGLSGFVTDIIRHEGVLYVSTGDGVYYLDAATLRFNEITGFATGISQSWWFLEVDGQLFVATGTGTYEIEGAGVRAITQNIVGVSSPSVIHRSRQDDDVLFLGLSDGVGMLRREASGRWVDAGTIPGITSEVRFIVEPEPGLLWLGSQTQSVLRVRFADATLQDPVIDQFGREAGLPGDGGTSVYQAGDRVVFAMKEGVARFDEASGRFVPDTLLQDVVSFGGSAEEYSVVDDDQGNLWVNFGQETAVLRPQADGTYLVDKTALLRFSDQAAYDIYPEANGVVWIGSNGTMFRYDTRVGKDYTASYTALIRRVMVGEDSTLYGGAEAVALAPTLAARENALRFEYAAPTYDNPLETVYQSTLEGFDDHRSGWTKEARRDYTNLPPGDYTFRVKAKNIYEHESAEAAYTFSILAPWYRTWWAYALYLLAGGVVLFGLIRLRTHQLEARSQELEQTVEARTAEIQQRVEELAVINSVQEGLVAALDMQAIYDLVGDRIRDLFDAQVVLIATFDHDAGLEYFHYAIEKSERHHPAPRSLDGVRRHLIHTRQLVLINENAEEARARFGMQIIPGTKMPRSSLFVPLVVGETVRGYVSLQNVDREQAFGDTDVRLLTTLANSMSVALENARLFDETTRLLAETEQRAGELDTVNHISRALVAQLEFDALVQLVGEQMRETFRASIVYVALHDTATNMIHFPYEHGDKTPSRPFGSGLTEKIITTREPLLINQAMEARRDELQAEQIGKVARSYLGVPIPAGDQAIGVISVQSTEEEGRFDEDDLRLLNTIAANVGVALHNAEAYRKLGATLEDLKTTQEQLVTQEKMASLGALTAGIAHEIKNPLNFVNNFAEVNQELTAELFEEIQAEPDLRVADVQDIIASLKINAAQIAKHGKRADAIVKNMMEHASGGRSERYPVGVNAFVEEYLNLAHHGAKAQVSSGTVVLKRDYDEAAGNVEMVPQEMGRVLVNLLNNAFEAVGEQANQVNGSYRPEVSVSTRRRGREVEIRVSDNGPGIPPEIREKIFEPFFTTKPTGSGTGLGLSLSYEIVTQVHGGTLSVESASGEGATFVVTLPMR